MVRIYTALGFTLKKTLMIVAMASLFILGPVQEASAAWYSFWAGVATRVGAGVAAVPGAGMVAGAVLGGVQIIAIVVDVGRALSMAPPPPQPFIAEPPEPPTFLAGTSAILNSNFQPLPIPGNEFDALVIATNAALTDTNLLIAHLNAGPSLEQFNADRLLLGNAIAGIADQYDALGISLTLSEAEIDAIGAQFAISGLPNFEIEFLQNAGWSAGDIQAFTEYNANMEINFSIPTISGGQALHGTADTILASVPEPSTYLLFGTGLVGLFGLAVWRRVRG